MVELVCDGCNDLYMHGHTVTYLREDARAHGWTYSKARGDRCPTCRKNKESDQ